MFPIFKTSIVIMLSALFVTACASYSAPMRDPHNDADSQRERAAQSQGELSRDTSK